jgi:hypothetical protein
MESQERQQSSLQGLPRMAVLTFFFTLTTMFNRQGMLRFGSLQLLSQPLRMDESMDAALQMTRQELWPI